MTESTHTSTDSRPPCVDKAMDECFIACNMTDVLLAFRGLDTLLARPKAENEDDAAARDGVVALLRFMRDSVRRRGKQALTALHELSTAIHRDRTKGTTRAD